jgi:hypothetical protein
MRALAINARRRMRGGGHPASLPSLFIAPAHSQPNSRRRVPPVQSNGSGSAMRHRLGRLLMLGIGTALLLVDPAISHDGQLERSRRESAHRKVELGRAYAKKQKWYVRAHRQISFSRDSAALSLADEHDLLLIARAAQVHRDYVLCVVGSAHSSSNRAANLRSNQRVQVVTEFLERSGDVPPNRLLSAGAMRAFDIQAQNHGSVSSHEPDSVEVEVLARAADL